MTATILDGKKIATDLQEIVAREVYSFTSSFGRSPVLAVIQVAHDPASDVYVANKIKACERVGIESRHHHFTQTTQQDLLTLIDQLNRDLTVDGILLQLPLPPGFKTAELIEALSPVKDVDGLHPLNQGYLFSGTPRFVPCTPLGCLHLIKTVYADLSGKTAVVIGRSVLVGRPLASLLLNENATVTITHSKTKNLEAITQTSDIVIVAIGSPQVIKASMIKPGAVVIDVGINRCYSLTQNKPYLTGDVDFESVKQVAGYLTPVPGGVGPMTITSLLGNTLKAAKSKNL